MVTTIGLRRILQFQSLVQLSLSLRVEKLELICILYSYTGGNSWTRTEYIKTCKPSWVVPDTQTEGTFGNVLQWTKKEPVDIILFS